MPNRIVREGINSSQRINRLSLGAELMYRRLILVADDFGRFHASPRTIVGACWPTCPEKVTPEEVARWLEECAAGERPLLDIYEIDGAVYLEIQDFGQRARSKSKFPAKLASSVRSLLTDCAQVDSNLSASCGQSADNCAQNVSTRRMRSSYSYAYANGDERSDPLVDTATEEEVAIRESCERMYALHPKKKDLPLLVPEVFKAARGVGYTQKLLDIEECHRAWSASPEWAEAGGRFVPSLAKWIADRGYTKWPADHPRSAAPVKRYKLPEGVEKNGH